MYKSVCCQYTGTLAAHVIKTTQCQFVFTVVREDIDVMETLRALKLATKRISERRNERSQEEHDNEIMCKGFLPSLADTKTACGKLEGIHVYPISPRTYMKD